ncbi:B3 domain-containing transcription factor ABI3-like [Apium graveolens]|uniref:B3 domain-containing transcription factor ABI3-like n=1 Tax=Apium graveolens TaxID=4045 RepID=UPI003D79F554
MNTEGIKQSNLKFLFQKQLQNSDVNNLKRMVIPKKAAEAYLPKLDKKGGTYIEMTDIDGSHIWNFIYRFWPNNKSRMYILENTGEFVSKHQLSTGDLVLVYQDRESKEYVIEARKTLHNILSDVPKRKTVRKHSCKASAQGQPVDDTPMNDVPVVAAPTSGVGDNLPMKIEITDLATNEPQLVANAANAMQLFDYGLEAYNPSGNIDNVLNLPNQNDNSSLIYNDANFPSDYLFNMWEPGASSTQPIPSFQNLCFDDILKGL